MRNIKNLLLFGLMCILFLVVFSTAISQDKKDDTYKALRLFSQIYRLVEQNYVREVNPKDLILGAIEGMLSSLDPHSALMKPEEFEELEVETKGSFSGIGIEITIKDDMLTVVAPIEDTPAWKAGLKPGDKILKIDEKPTKGMKITEAVKLLRGPKGTPVRVTILRGERNVFEVTIVRDVIPIISVRTRILEPGVGYVRISQFQEKTPEELRNALNKLETEGAIKGLILDLRNNPGGLLNSAIEVSDEFLEEGLIVSMRGRTKANQMEFRAKPNQADRKHKFPIVVLINHGTASAAEIVTGALKDNKRAVVIGEKSFGKGSVQTVIPIEDNYAVRLTTALYYTPNGQSIHNVGLTPDFTIPATDLTKVKGKNSNQTTEIISQRFPTVEEDLQIKIALEILKNINSITQLKY